MVFLVLVAVVWSCAVAGLVALFMGRDRLLVEAAHRALDPWCVPAERPAPAPSLPVAATAAAEVPGPAVGTGP